MSFATAAHRLGASAITLPVEQSSVRKGETLEDTARTLNAMHPDALVIRHHENGAPAAVALVVDAPVINAGDGTNEHPTQALLDAAAIRHRFGKIGGLKIAICGDIKHSRVARSNGKLLPRLGAEVRLAGPPELMPDGVPPLSIDEAIAGADVVMMLRVQRERLDEDLGDRPGEFLSRYGLTPERLARAAPNAVVMHPGPMNRGVEIDGAPRRRRQAVADHASGRDGRGRSDGLPGDVARLSARRIGRARRRRTRGRSICRPGSSAPGSEPGRRAGWRSR